MSDQLEFNRLTAFDSAGDPVSGAKAYFYQTGTTTPVTVYSDTALSVAHASPLVADSSGVFAPVYYGSATAVKVVVTDASDVTLYTIDPVRKVSGSASAASSITFAPTSEIAETNVQAAIEAVQENATLNFNVISKTANYTVLTTDKSNLIRCTSTLTLSLTAAASLGDGFTFTVEASGATVTIDPDGSETINGAATLTVNDGEFASVFCSGSAFYAAVYPAALSQTTWNTGTSTIEAKISPAKLKNASGLVQMQRATVAAAADYTATIPFDDTIPQNTEGSEVLTLAITPTNASNLLVVDATIYCSSNVGSMQFALALFRDGAANALQAEADYLPDNGYIQPIRIRHVVVAGSTSATTFKLRLGPSTAATLTVNGVATATRRFGGTLISSMTVSEVRA